MTITYAITVCDELMEIQRLVTHLLKHKRPEDNIVIVYDTDKGSQQVHEYLASHSVNGEFNWHAHPLNGDFSQFKNRLLELCDGDYIYQIDADEMVSEFILKNLHTILQSNPQVDVFLVPRINTVEGLTGEHINKWGWNVDEKGWINFPDLQSRICKNDPEIRWGGKVHERLSKEEMVMTALPFEEQYCIEHHKTIEKQEQQNAYYEKL